MLLDPAPRPKSMIRFQFDNAEVYTLLFRRARGILFPDNRDQGLAGEDGMDVGWGHVCLPKQGGQGGLIECM